MSDWSNFKKLTRLTFNYLDVIGELAKIYGNTRNQVEISISVVMLGLDDKELIVDQNYLKNSLYLCDYFTGEPLDSPWIVSNESNGYTKAISNSAQNRKKREFRR